MDNCGCFQDAAFGQCNQGDPTAEAWNIGYMATYTTFIPVSKY